MAKKNETTVAPEVHRIALPVSDESLVIDLPDGQKLVVGKLASGSVIEVATWRGTGRPDSRTTRLMLGMSASASAEDIPERKQGEAASIAAKDFKSKAIAALAKLKSKIAEIKRPRFAALKPKSLQEKTSVEETSIWTPKSPEESTAGEVDKWLEEVMERSRKRSERLANKEELTSNKKDAPRKAPPKKKPAKRRAR